MHPFATNSTERQHIPFFLAFIAIAAGIVTSWALSVFHIDVPWWAPPLDTMTFYGLLFWIFDRFIWKWRLIQYLQISRLPVLVGEWHGQVEPAERIARGSAMQVTVTISQSWLGLSIRGVTSQSRSHSLSASLLVGDENTLTYEYMNEPLANAPATMHAHRGTANLTLQQGGTVLEGEYYSGRDRRSFGTIRLTRLN